ncbi:hypothetical protein ABIC08_009309 [Bradyrhizobium sp. RT9b]
MLFRNFFPSLPRPRFLCAGLLIETRGNAPTAARSLTCSTCKFLKESDISGLMVRLRRTELGPDVEPFTLHIHS